MTVAPMAALRPGFPEETTARLLPEELRVHGGGSVSSTALVGPQLAVRNPVRFTLAIMGRSGVGKSAITLRYMSWFVNSPLITS